MTAYSTFWRRFWAGFWDGVILAIPIAVLQAIFHVKRGDHSIGLYTVIQSVVFIVYSVGMHARYGQTVGKKWTGVIVLDKTETRIPTLKEAVMRDIGEIIPTALVSGVVLTAYLNGEYDLDPQRYDPFVTALGAFNGLWFLTELVTMLTNSRKRALHDYIAGTVVMRKDSVPVGVLDTLRA